MFRLTPLVDRYNELIVKFTGEPHMIMRLLTLSGMRIKLVFDKVSSSKQMAFNKV
jgi:hypothetical protein